MSSYLNKEWDWNSNYSKDSENVSDVNLIIFENDSDEYNKYTSDDNGNISIVVREAFYQIDNETDITKTAKTPHYISIYKYGLKYIGLNINFTASRNDTFYLEENKFITESDKSVVDGYSGISIDDDNKLITLTEDRTINELYDYIQSYIIDNPLKDYLVGYFNTSDGNNFILEYDLKIDGCNFTGDGKYIDMSNNELTLDNGGSTNVTIKDKNGVKASLTLFGIVENSEVRIYKSDDMTELDGVENLDGDTFIYTYTYNDEDIDIVIVIFNEEYEPIRQDYTLDGNNTKLPISQVYDRNFKS